uniref:Ovule protein n=1 Tax=Echinococcus granulosus TaxID=6210 RepID=A0A068X4Y3_ECHGR|nr:hypothetical protein EgrG_000357400 [Echinococcus granulosus]
MMCESEFVCATFFCAYLGFALLNYFNVVSLATWCVLWASVRFLEATVNCKCVSMNCLLLLCTLITCW